MDAAQRAALVAEPFVHDPEEGLTLLDTAQVLAKTLKVARGAQLAGAGSVRGHDHVLERP